jgi:hypothetical protein
MFQSEMYDLPSNLEAIRNWRGQLPGHKILPQHQHVFHGSDRFLSGSCRWRQQKENKKASGSGDICNDDSCNTSQYSIGVLTELKLSKILHLFKEMNGKTFYYQSKTSMRASTNTMRVQFSSILFPRQFCLNSTCKKINMPLNLHDQTYHVLRAISEHSLIKWCHCEHLQEGILKGLRVWAAGLKLFIVSNENLMCCFCIGCLL